MKMILILSLKFRTLFVLIQPKLTYNFFFFENVYFIFFLLQNDTFHVRWAYSQKDPSKEPADLSQLPPISRTGSRSLHLYESHHQFNQATADALQWLVQSNR